jgi:hypothetical protein
MTTLAGRTKRQSLKALDPNDCRFGLRVSFTSGQFAGQDAYVLSMVASVQPRIMFESGAIKTIYSHKMLLSNDQSLDNCSDAVLKLLANHLLETYQDVSKRELAFLETLQATLQLRKCAPIFLVRRDAGWRF